MKTVYERADVVPLLAEIFRELGYEGTTLSRITDRTGLGKGSLYHFFPGGKEEMAMAVLGEIDAWFEKTVFRPLLEEQPASAILSMWQNVDAYFHSGGRICLVGAFSVDETRDRFADLISQYFRRWIYALDKALIDCGFSEADAKEMAEECVAGIQGALVLSRALNDPAAFARSLRSLRKRTSIPHGKG